MPGAVAADLINEIHKIFETTLRFHHGKLIRFTGDTALGVFYSGHTISPAAIHALDAAFAVREQLQLLFAKKFPGQPFGAKMGIASGNMTETEIGTGESRQTAIFGEAVNHAERICRFCGSDQILAGKNVFEATGKYYKFQKMEPIPPKGGVESLPIFELLKKNYAKLR